MSEREGASWTLDEPDDPSSVQVRVEFGGRQRGVRSLSVRSLAVLGRDSHLRRRDREDWRQRSSSIGSGRAKLEPSLVAPANLRRPAVTGKAASSRRGEPRDGGEFHRYGCEMRRSSADGDRARGPLDVGDSMHQNGLSALLSTVAPMMRNRWTSRCAFNCARATYEVWFDGSNGRCVVGAVAVVVGFLPRVLPTRTFVDEPGEWTGQLEDEMA